MARYPKPAEGSWTEHYPAVGTGGVSYEDCVSPEFYAAENDCPREETRGFCRTFTGKHHAWRYALDGSCTFVQQESEFFDLDNYQWRLAHTMAQMQPLSDAGFPRIGEVLAHCDQFPLDAMPDDARRLLEFVHSLIMVAMCVEIWHRPRGVDGADAEIHRVGEPVP